MKSVLIWGLAIVAVGGIIFLSVPSGNSDEEFAATIAQERRDKDEFMRTAEESPFAAEPGSFKPLSYFEVSRKYDVKATLEKIEHPQVVVLPTSTGEVNTYLEYAWASFELDGVTSKLLLLEIMATGPTRGTLFLAFADETSARETYGAGRYLDLKKVAGATTIRLDFNRAYNPYCAYNDHYSCPLPPNDNILKVAIRAGEKSFPKDATP